MKHPLRPQITCFLLLLLLVCGSCGTQSTSSKDPRNASLTLKVDESVPFEWPQSLVVEDIVYLDTDSDFIISRMDKLMVSPDRNHFYIVDLTQAKLLIFDAKGRPVKVFDKKGNGPEEYMALISDMQVNFEKGLIEVIDHRRIQQYDLNTFDFVGTVDLRKIPGDQNFREFVQIADVYYLWTNIPPNQRFQTTLDTKPKQFHLIRYADGNPEYYIEEKYGVSGNQRFYPSGIRGEYLLTPLVGETDIMAINKDSLYVKYQFNFGDRGLPEFELQRFFGRMNEILHTDYYKFLDNIRETRTHLFFIFAGNARSNFVLFNKETKQIQSIGKNKEKLIPNVVASDADGFYTYIDPARVEEYLREGGDLTKNSFLKNMDTSRLGGDLNPILIRFRIDP